MVDTLHNNQESNDPNRFSVALFKFSGGRFDAQKGMPASAFQEVERYQQLLSCVARDLYLSKHPKATKVPKKYREQFDLYVSKFEDGSAIPLLEGDKTSEDVVTEAISIIESVHEQLANRGTIETDFVFKEDTKTAFGLFGKGLKDDECIMSGPGYSNVLTKSDSAWLRDELMKLETVKDQSVAGFISSVDPNRKKFELRLLGGKIVQCNYSDNSIDESLKDLLVLPEVGHTRQLTRLICTYERDVMGIRKILDVSDVERFMSNNNPWTPRIMDLLSYEQGWYEGYGEPVPVECADYIDKILNELEKKKVTRPGIFPDPEGGLTLESNKYGFHLSVEVILDEKPYGYYFNRETGVEVSQEFSSPSEVAGFIERYMVHG